VRSHRWKWIGLGTIAAIALGSAVVVQRRRHRRWEEYDTTEIRRRLHKRFAGIDDAHA
jgi:hypothetical protein